MIKNYTCKVKPFQNLNKVAEDIANGKPLDQIAQTDFAVKIEFIADQVTAQRIVKTIHEIANDHGKQAIQS